MSSVSHVSPAEELAAFLARGPSPEEIAHFHLSVAALERVRVLLDKNGDGALPPEESREQDRLVLLDDIIALVQSHVSTPNGETSDGEHSERLDAQEAENDHIGAPETLDTQDA